MPLLNAGHAQTVMVLKLTMNRCSAGLEDELLLHDETRKLFGDTHGRLTKVVATLRAS